MNLFLDQLGKHKLTTWWRETCLQNDTQSNDRCTLLKRKATTMIITLETAFLRRWTFLGLVIHQYSWSTSVELSFSYKYIHQNHFNSDIYFLPDKHCFSVSHRHSSFLHMPGHWGKHFVLQKRLETRKPPKGCITLIRHCFYCIYIWSWSIILGRQINIAHTVSNIEPTRRLPEIRNISI